MTGYKAMLRDRLIPIWDLALMWCKVKTKWINLAYKTHIQHVGKSRKSITCKFIAGRRGEYGVRCDFMRTVTRDDCFRANNPEEYEFWKAVESWVNWFARRAIYMKDDIYSISEEEFKSKYDVDTKLYKFILKHSDLL